MYTAIVTGGAQGIGKAISNKIIEQGVFVFVLDADSEALIDFADETAYPHNCQTLQCDVSDASQLSKILHSIAQQKPSLRYLVNNAGISEFKPFQELSLEEWHRILNTNLTSYFLTVKYLSDSMIRNKGSVVNICSTRALMSEPHSEAYAASKGGVFSLTHAQAMSLEPNVRVNSISPGWIDVSEWKKKSLRKKINWQEKHHAQHPVGRIGKPEDVAEMAWYLLSDQSGFVTAQNFIIDGGMTRKMIYEED